MSTNGPPCGSWLVLVLNPHQCCALVVLQNTHGANGAHFVAALSLANSAPVSRSQHQGHDERGVSAIATRMNRAFFSIIVVPSKLRPLLWGKGPNLSASVCRHAYLPVDLDGIVTEPILERRTFMETLPFWKVYLSCWLAIPSPPPSAGLDSPRVRQACPWKPDNSSNSSQCKKR